MSRQILFAALPYVGLLVVAVGVLAGLAYLAGARVRLTRLAGLHADRTGGVQSLSFVLTLPIFIIVMLIIVQLSQITIAAVVVEYAAFAAARCAVVWIPAYVAEDFEEENQIAGLRYEGDEVRAGERYSIYSVAAESPKLNKIHLAAATACMPICPSRDVGAEAAHGGNAAAEPMITAYRAISPATAGNTEIPDRIRNKLAYALLNTQVQIEIAHSEDEPPLVPHFIDPEPRDFRPGEIGWADQVTVTVTHNFALLPGPARVLARRADAPPGTSPEADYGADEVARSIAKVGRTYVRQLSATARLTNEGEKPALRYVQPLHGGGM